MCRRRAGRVRPRPRVPASADPGGAVRRDAGAGARRLAPRCGARPGGGGRAGGPGGPAAAAGRRRPWRPGRADGRVDAGLAGPHRGPAGRPGARGGGRTPHPGRGQFPGRLGPARLAGQPARRRPLPHRRPGRGRAGGEPRAGARRRARSPRGPALDAGAVPHAGRRVRGVPGHAGPGAGFSRDLGPAPRPAARARRADAHQPRRGREGGPGRRQRARGGVGGGRQLGHGLGAARADARDLGAGDA